MSILATYLTQNCTIVHTDSPDSWGALQEISETTAACRFTRIRKQVTLPDGTMSLVKAQLLLGNEEIVPGDRVRLPDELTIYRVLQVEEAHELGATIVAKRVYLI